jgi:hypothetical protein
MFSMTASASDKSHDTIQGVWQSSFAYLGKIPYFNGYLIVTDDKIIDETNGELNYQFSYVMKESTNEYFILEILDSDYKGKYARINLNSKFGCKPKSKLSYDKSCNSLHWDNVFSFCIYDQLSSAKLNESKCSMKDKYFTFTKSQIDSIEKASGNL